MRPREAVVAAVLTANRVPALRRLNGLPYDACLAALRRACARIPGVRAVYIPRDYQARTWEPGSSDIDLCVVLESMPRPEEERTLRRLWRALLGLGAVFPFLSAGFAGVPVYSLDDLAMPEFGWRAMALHAHAPPERWTLVHGQECRHLIRQWEPSPPRRLPASPAVLSLVDKHLHAPLIAGKQRPLPGHLGSEARLARKLLAALEHDGHTPADIDPGGQLDNLLGRLETGGGFVERGQDGDRLRRRLGLGLLRALEAAFSPAPEGGRWSGEQPPVDPALHDALARGVPPSAAAVTFPRSHLVHRSRPPLGICLVLGELQPEPHRQALQLLGRLRRGRGQRLHMRLLGPAAFAALTTGCGANYVFEGQHMARLGGLAAGALPAPAPPEPEVARLAITRRLAVERAHILRSCLEHHHLGAPFGECLDPLLGLASYRIFLGGGLVVTAGRQILERHHDLFGGDALHRHLDRLCALDPGAPVTLSLLDAYRGASLDMVEACWQA